MDNLPGTNHLLRFGVFEADIETGELRKQGLRVRLSGQPFQVLARLLKSPGTLVTREELKDELWPDDTFVDFESGVNGAIRRIRRALDDSADTPRYVETLPRRGYRFIGAVEGGPLEVASEGQQPISAGESAEVPPLPVPEPITRRRQLLPWLLFAATGIALLVVSTRDARQTRPEARLRKFVITPPVAIRRDPTSNPTMAAISPDGQRIAFAGGTAGGKLWVQEFDGFEARPLEHTEGARGLFWSPDSEFICFATGTELKRAAIQGGQTVRLCTLPGTAPFNYGGGAWSPDGKTVAFSSDGVIYEVPALGGAPVALIKPDRQSESAEEPWGRVYRPRFLASHDGRRILAFAYGAFGPRGSICVQDLDSGRRELLGPGVRPVYSPSGHLVYEPHGNARHFLALPFSLENLKATGEAFPIAHGGSNASISADGTLVYTERPVGESRLVWLDRGGRRLGELGAVEGSIRDPDLSPDGRRVAIAIGGGVKGQDIWVFDTVRDSAVRVTTALENDHSPAWSPSGEYVAYSSNRGGGADILIQRVDGAGEEEETLGSTPRVEVLKDWSWDGKYLLFQSGEEPRNMADIWYAEQDGGAGNWGEARPFLKTPFNEQAPKLSPDGRYVAYVSDISGRWEVYVDSFPESATRELISTNGGAQPRWRRDGKELYYVEDDTLVAVSVTTAPTFSRGSATRLFPHPTLQDTTAHPQYDVSDDGQRFILDEPAGEPPAPRIRVVQNWFAEFNDRGND